MRLHFVTIRRALISCFLRLRCFSSVSYKKQEGGRAAWESCSPFLVLARLNSWSPLILWSNVLRMREPVNLKLREEKAT